MTVAQTDNTCQRERKAWVADEPGSLLSVIIALTSLSAKTDNHEMFTINTKPTYLAFFSANFKASPSSSSVRGVLAFSKHMLNSNLWSSTL